LEYKSNYLKNPKGLLKYKDSRIIVSNDGFFSQLDLSRPTSWNRDFRDARLNFNGDDAATVGLAWISYEKITRIEVNKAISIMVSAAVAI